MYLPNLLVKINYFAFFYVTLINCSQPKNHTKLMIARITTRVKASFNTVIENFDARLFNALSPPLIKVNLLRFDGCQKDDKVHVELNILGFKQNWEALVVADENSNGQWYFKDIGSKLPFPLKSWEHRHYVNKIDKETVEIIDDVNYRTINPIVDILVYPFIYFQFFWRKHIYKTYFLDK